LTKKLGKVIVVKIGGATLGSYDTTIEDIVALQKQGSSLVVVHGGGKLITEWLDKQGLSSRFVSGERITDRAMLEVVIAVLAGLANKEVVAALNNRGGQAVGISGVDGALIQGRVKDASLGYVGSVVKVNIAPLTVLLQSGYLPVVAPVSLHSVDRPEEAPQILNVNADVVAGEIAAAIDAERLIFLTDVAGICDRSGQLLPRLSSGEAEALIASGVVSGGMIPKVKACIRALPNISTARIIDGRQSHALLYDIEGGGGGTTIHNPTQGGESE
jgi:acetylglutamate kinase